MQIKDTDLALAEVKLTYNEIQAIAIYDQILNFVVQTEMLDNDQLVWLRSRIADEENRIVGEPAHVREFYSATKKFINDTLELYKP
jgi:hypothetical protein